MRLLRYHGMREVDFPAPPEELSEDIILYFMRHGATASDLDNKFCGWTDEPMSEEGKTAVREAVATVVSQLVFGPVFTDDLERTIETAKAVLPYSKSATEITVNPMARTWGVGDLAGQIKTALAIAAKKFFVQNPDVIPPGANAETLNQSRRRWLSFLAYVIAVTRPGVPSFVCCHSSNIKTTSQAYGLRIKLNPTGIMRMVINSQGVTISVLRVGNLVAESVDDIKDTVEA